RDEEEDRRERDARREEDAPATEAPRPHAVGDRADRWLDDDALDAARAREQTGDEVRRADGLERERQQEVVERVERARTDRSGGVEKHRAGASAHGGGAYLRPFMVAKHVIEQMFHVCQ